MNKIVQHIWQAIRFENTEALVPVFDTDRPVRSTADMPTWFTGRPCERTKRSHDNFCIFDSTWEATEAFELDRNEHVEAWVKNDHLGFEILYVFKGVIRKYRPDFLIRLKSGKMLVLEVKGQDSQENHTKREFLDEWVRAVNAQGAFGAWAWGTRGIWRAYSKTERRVLVTISRFNSDSGFRILELKFKSEVRIPKSAFPHGLPFG